MFLKKLLKTLKEIFWLHKPKELVINFGKKDETHHSATESQLIEANLIPTTEQVAELPWFSRANNLVAEFKGSEPVISPSKFGSWDEKLGDLDYDGLKKKTKEDKYWNIEIPYQGYVILGQTPEDIFFKKRQIDNCIKNGEVPFGFYTIDQFMNEFGVPESWMRGLETKEDDLVADDVDLLENKIELKKPTTINYNDHVSNNK